MDLQAKFCQVKAKETGAYITMWSEFDRGVGGATAMGQKGVRIEAVAQQAFHHWSEFQRSGATFDAYVADQVLATAVVAKGETLFKVPKLTSRFLTMVWVAKQFLPIPITIKGHEDTAGSVHIKR